MNISKNSWHYRLATTFSMNLKYQDSLNFCSYFWEVVLALFVTTIMVSMIGFFEVSLVDFCTWLYVRLFVGPVEMNPRAFLAEAVVIVSSVILVVLVLRFIIIEMMRKYKSMNSEELAIEKNPGFIALSYDKFKNKICIKLNVVE